MSRWRRPSSRDDAGLVAAAQADSVRFADIYELYVGVVYRYLMRRTGDHHAAEDLTAETFERAFRSIGRFEWRGAPLSSWLIRIADRACVDYFRLQGRRQETTLRPDAGSVGAPSAEHQSLSNEQDARLYRALDTLSPGRRQVILLHLGESMTLAAIARRLGRGEGAIRMLYARALKDLRGKLGDD